ncbi:unnamed protein product [Pieris macdunnoughi]|uniref:Uncharacterized protein n=1 Tax=Pieris macdunnoughi TaxID=345717 RepID=A0A821W1T2_9NEOP|nr:unnamed protein product [Pieris macdunnoughi]
MEMSALKNALQEPVLTIVMNAFKRQRLKKAKRVAQQQMLAANAPRLQADPKPTPEANTAAGFEKRALKRRVQSCI